MKRNWDLHELIEHWTLLPQELELLQNRTSSTRLGFAVNLKFFQNESKFPKNRIDTPKAVLAFIAQQVNVEPEEFQNYDCHGRSSRYHRQQIREFCGFRSPTSEDADDLREWLLQTVLPQTLDSQTLENAATQRLRDLSIGAMSFRQLDRIIHAATRVYELRFCQGISKKLTPETQKFIDQLLTGAQSENSSVESGSDSQVKLPTFKFLSTDPGGVSLEHLFQEIEKLKLIRQMDLPLDLFHGVSPKIAETYRMRAATERLTELRRHPSPVRYTLMAAFYWQRGQEITDNLVDLLIQIVHKLDIKAERQVTEQLTKDFKRVEGKEQLLYRIACAVLENPEGSVKDVIYPVASLEKIQNLVQEIQLSGTTYRRKIHKVVRGSYQHHYRRMVPKVLEILEFRSNNEVHRPVIEALNLLKKYTDSQQQHYDREEAVPLDGVLRSGWRDILTELDPEGKEKIDRVNFEIAVLQALRTQLRCKEIWVVGAQRYRNPEEDLPTDFEVNRQDYYQALEQPTNSEEFIEDLQAKMKQALEQLDEHMPHNRKVKLLDKKNGWIKVSPLSAQPEPVNLLTSLLDVLKETDLRVGFTQLFQSSATRETIDSSLLQKRLLLSLYALGTNTGLKRISNATPGVNRDDLRYVRRRFIHKDHLRQAIAQVVNATLHVRQAHVWGEGSVACASDSKKFGVWEQNLTTEWHTRYGGRGIMVYWHVEKKSACIYSQLKTCSSSEVAAMITGVLRHETEMNLQKNYVDTHGQSEVGFAFSHLLGFELLPRFKAIHSQKLYRPEAGMANAYPNLQLILTRPIRWELIRQQYDQMIKYATALRLGTAEAEAILSRFSQNPKHPTYLALAELGKVLKTIFLCHYLDSEALRQEINEGLNVVENWNSANSFIFYGKSGEISSNDRLEQEMALLSLHLLQMCVVYINTLMIQQVLAEPKWVNRLNKEDLRGLTPLIYGHINPYGMFLLDLSKRLALELVS
jgi:TnpA family transposase